MRRWIARQFHPDRRWQSVWLLVMLAWIAFSFAIGIDFRRRIDWERELRITREMMERADRVEDLAEKQRLFQAVQARSSPQEVTESLRRSEVSLRVSYYAIPILGATLLPVTIAGARQKRRQRWLKSGRCVACGYDLRASPDRCPECGTMPSDELMPSISPSARPVPCASRNANGFIGTDEGS